MFTPRVIPLVAVLAVAGCRSAADVLRLDPTIRPATHPDSVLLLAQEPEQPYTVIALVSARTGWLGEPPEVNLRREAARLGGDAVLLGTESLTRIGTGGDGGTVLQVSGKVIVFKRAARAPK